MFNGFEHRMIDVDGLLSAHIGGSGPPLLFLHGYPQTAATWLKVMPAFAEHFTCVAVDLPGYGDSAVPEDEPDHRQMSKRRIAERMVALMGQLGFERFCVLGHDRGARVSYRMAFDHPERVEKLGIIEVVPTAEMWDAMDFQMAMGAYHWPFLAQPAPLPETLIAADPIMYLEWTLKSWTMTKSLDVFAPVSLAHYRKQAGDPARIHAMCEDYRAGARIDREIDLADREAGRRIKAPFHFVWSNHGFPARTRDPLGIWKRWAASVTGEAVESGHFAPEENPDGVAAAVVPFFRA